MKTLMRIFAIVFLVSLPSQSQAWLPPPVEVDIGFNAWCNIRQAGQVPGRAPWYLYWPHEAHFQTPAPVGGRFPHWPSRLSYGNPGYQQNGQSKSTDKNAGSNTGKTQSPPQPQFSAPQPQPILTPTGYQPVQAHHYYRQGQQRFQYYQPPNYWQQAPSYWYGR